MKKKNWMFCLNKKKKTSQLNTTIKNNNKIIIKKRNFIIIIFFYFCFYFVVKITKKRKLLQKINQRNFQMNHQTILSCLEIIITIHQKKLTVNVYLSINLKKIKKIIK